MTIETAVLIDWITVTAKDAIYNEREEIKQTGRISRETLEAVTSFDGEGFVYEQSGRWGYTERAQHRNGCTVLWNSPIDRMGVNITYTGTSLNGIDALERLRWHVQRGHKVTRLDVACDVHLVEHRFDLTDYYNQLDADIPVRRSRDFSLSRSSSGTTVYVGGRTSNRMLRVYDKGGEQGAGQGHWLRAELVLKGDTARGTAQYLIQEQDLSCVQSMILDVCRFDGDLWEAWMGTKPIRITSSRRDTDTEAWLTGVVAKTLAKEIVGGNEQIKSRFEAAVKVEVSRLLSES